MKRVATALLLIPFAIYSIFFAPYWWFVGVVALMAILCYYEFAAIAAAQSLEGPLWLGYPGGLLLLWNQEPIPILIIVVLATALSVRQLQHFLPSAAATMAGMLYVFAAWRCAIDLREISPYWVLFALAITWVGDVAAFYVGRTFGRHKLAPRVSPGKSWEGAAGSVVAAVAFSAVFHRYVSATLPLPLLLALGIIANVAGQLGDLAESAMKRGAGVKDSGMLLPGHGGFLDRLDSSLFTMPIVWYFLKLAASAK